MLLQLPRVLRAQRPNPIAVRLAAGATRTLELPLHCARFGGFALGPLLLRSGDRLGFTSWETRLGGREPLRVYPRVETLHALLVPHETQPFVGNQVSRAKSEGVEFADIRDWAPGDRVARSTGARAPAAAVGLLVNEQHPERNTDVVLFLDTFADVESDDDRGTFDMTVRAATSLAHLYLQRKDRVGLVSFGGYLSWLLPASGTQHLYRIVDSLLQMNIVLSFASKGVDILPPRTLPPKALVHRTFASARSSIGVGSARPARAGLRPRRDRGLARSVRPGRQGRARRSLVPTVAVDARVAARAVRAGRRAGDRVDRRPSAERCARGGGDIQAIRTHRTRIVLATGSALAYAGVLAYAAIREPNSPGSSPASARSGRCSSASCSFAEWTTCCRGRWSCSAAHTRCRSSCTATASTEARRSSQPACCLRRTCGLVSRRAACDRRGPRRADRTRDALGALVVASLAAAGLVVALSLAPGTGLAWTVLGAAASVLAVALAVRLSQRAS